MLFVALVSSACAVPVDHDGAVEVDSEALNNVRDFQVGIVGIRYDAQGLTKSWEAWSPPASSIGGFAYSPYTPGLKDATGVRIGIKAVGAGPSIFPYMDFRLRIQAKNSNSGQTGPVELTRWASEGGSYTGAIQDAYNASGYNQFRIGLEARLWPADNTYQLHDLSLEVLACGANLFLDCGGHPLATKKKLSELADGEPTWSYTSNIADGNLPITYVDVGFIADLR
jgi:hypothetical protein